MNIEPDNVPPDPATRFAQGRSKLDHFPSWCRPMVCATRTAVLTESMLRIGSRGGCVNGAVSRVEVSVFNVGCSTELHRDRLVV